MRTRLLVAAALVLGLATMAIAADPFVGTWKLNVAKSKITGQTPKSETLKIATQNNGFKWTFDTVDAEGKATH